MAQTNVQAFSGDVVISSNLEVGTANLFVDTTTSNVGINTNTPGYTLDVTGDIHLSGNLYQGGEAFEAGLWSSGVSSNIYYTGGKVGIGLTNPVATLDIVGPMRLGDGLSNVVDFSIVTIPTIGDHIWQAELVHPSPASSDYFSWSVSISGDGLYALVGAYADDTGGSQAGSAQVYVGVPGDGGISELVVSTPIKADGTLLSFTGQHICFPEGRMSQGLVVSANQNKYMSLNGPVTMGLGAIKSSESLPVVSLSNVANDRSVFGVVDRFEGNGTERTQTIGIGKVSSAKEVGDNRVIVNSIGEGALWVANTNGNLVSGDYLTTSSLPGYAQKQDSDSLKNSTVAKITMACDFSPEDIPVQIIKKKDNGDNDLDPYGRFQWVDTEKTQKAYKVRYLTSDGKGTDQSNAVHILAYVGCTYHCG